MTQRDGMGRWEGSSGWGTHVNPQLIHVNVWQNPLQYCKVISLQLIKINEKKKRHKGAWNTPTTQGLALPENGTHRYNSYRTVYHQMKQRTKGTQPRFHIYVNRAKKNIKKEVQSASRMYIKSTLKMHSNIYQVQTNAVWFHLHDVPRIVKSNSQSQKVHWQMRGARGWKWQGELKS